MLSIVEIFDSIQGEGSWVGKPVTFIRLSGCNLSCSFCDEPLHKDPTNATEMEVSDVVSGCRKYVVITGGEPSLQSDVTELIYKLKANGCKVAVESNGFSYDAIKGACLKTLAPKNYARPKGHWGDVKLLVSTDNVKQFEIEVDYWKTQRVKLFVSAINDETSLNVENNKLAYEKAMELDLILNVQLHKILGVR